MTLESSVLSKGRGGDQMEGLFEKAHPCTSSLYPLTPVPEVQTTSTKLRLFELQQKVLHPLVPILFSPFLWV